MTQAHRNIGNAENTSTDESNTFPKPATTDNWYNFTLPGSIPDANVNFTKDGSTVSFTL